MLLEEPKEWTKNCRENWLTEEGLPRVFVRFAVRIVASSMLIAPFRRAVEAVRDALKHDGDCICRQDCRCQQSDCRHNRCSHPAGHSFRLHPRDQPAHPRRSAHSHTRISRRSCRHNAVVTSSPRFAGNFSRGDLSLDRGAACGHRRAVAAGLAERRRSPAAPLQGHGAPVVLLQCE